MAFNYLIGTAAVITYPVTIFDLFLPTPSLPKDKRAILSRALATEQPTAVTYLPFMHRYSQGLP